MGLLDSLGSLLGIGGNHQVDYGNGIPFDQLSQFPGAAPTSTPTAWGATSQPRPSGLKDFFGRLNDARLIQYGHDPIYAPKQDELKQQEALQGFMDDPMAAIQRLYQTHGGIKAGNELYKTLTESQSAQANTALHKAQLGNVGLGQIAGWASRINKNNAAHILPLIQRLQAQTGVELPPFDANDPEGWGRDVAEASMKAYQRDRLEQFGQQIGIQDRNATTNERNAGTNARNAGSNAIRAEAAAKQADTSAGALAEKKVPKVHTRTTTIKKRTVQTPVDDVGNMIAAANVQHPPTPGVTTLFANGKAIAKTSNGKTWDIPIR